MKMMNYFPDKTYIEKEKIPELIRGILNGCESIIDGTPLSMVLLAIVYSFTEAFSHLNFRIYDKSETKGEPITTNMMAMMFYKSGGGKDFVVETCRNHLFKGIHEKMSVLMYDMVAKNSESLMKELKDGGYKGNIYNRKYAEGVTQPIHSFYRQGTAESIPSLARSIKKFNFGAINYWIGEFLQFYDTQNEAVKNFWWALQMAFDKGCISVKSTKGESADKPMSLVPVNIFGSATLDKYIESSIIQRRLKQDMVDGCARRFFVCCPDKNEEREKSSDHMFDQKRKEGAIDMLQDVGKMFLQLWDSFYDDQLERVITFSQEARDIMSEYSRKCVERRGSKFDGANWKYDIELDGRVMKVMKIGAVFALMEGKTTISEVNLCHAIYFTEYYSQHYYRFTQTPLHGEAHRMFKYLLYHENTAFTRSDFACLGGYESARDGKGGMFNDTMKMVAEIATTQNCRLIEESRLRVVYYMIVKQDAVMAPVRISMSEDKAKRYRPITVSFDDLHTHIINKHEMHYSAFTFNNEYRNQPNSNRTNDIFILDIDDGLTLKEATVKFKAFNCFLVTTRNHQREKNGKVCDRFRVVIKLTNEFIYRNNEHFRSIIQYFATKHSIPADTTCYEISRMYFTSPPGATYIRITGKDLSLAQYDISEEKMDESQSFKPLRQTQAGSIAEFEEWATKFYDHNASVGSRNNTLFRIAAWAKDSGFSRSYWTEFILYLDKKSPHPIGEREITQTLFASAKLR